MHLAVQHDSLETLPGGQIQQRRDDHPADPMAAVRFNYRHATESTGGFQPSRADCVTVFVKYENVRTKGILGVELAL